MVQFVDTTQWIDEEAPRLNIDLPQVKRQPRPPSFHKSAKNVEKLVFEAKSALLEGQKVQFGQTYGQLQAVMNPVVQWALSCWEYLLSTEKCRFIDRPLHEKRFYRGDYRVFSEKDYHGLVIRSFKRCLIHYIETSPDISFGAYLKQHLWPTILERYKSLEQPTDPEQRKLTGYSYLRCIPYQFLNHNHQEKVYRTIYDLPEEEQTFTKLYYLRFQTARTVREKMGLTHEMFKNLKTKTLERLKGLDKLSWVLLRQIERY